MRSRSVRKKLRGSRRSCGVDGEIPENRAPPHKSCLHFETRVVIKVCLIPRIYSFLEMSMSRESDSMP